MIQKNIVHMEQCDIRVTAYKDGRTFDDCRKIARSLLPKIKSQIDKVGHISWNDALAISEHDAVVYKLAMKYLKQEGYDIGNNVTPQIRHRLI